MAFSFSLSALSWWQCSISKLFSLGWSIIARNSQLCFQPTQGREKAVADVAGTTSSNLVKRQT